MPYGNLQSKDKEVQQLHCCTQSLTRVEIFEYVTYVVKCQKAYIRRHTFYLVMIKSIYKLDKII